MVSGPAATKPPEAPARLANPSLDVQDRTMLALAARSLDIAGQGQHSVGRLDSTILYR